MQYLHLILSSSFSTIGGSIGLMTFFVLNFRQLATKKRGLRNPTKGILRIFKIFLPYHEEKKLEVDRFKQCVPLGSQN